MNKWLSFSDIKPIIDKYKVNSKNKIQIRTYEQVHKAVGLIILSIQEFELLVKQVLIKFNAKDEKLGLKGIGDLIAYLGNKKVIKEKDMKLLRETVKIRNYVSHHFYLEWKDKNIYNLTKIENVLNASINIINSAKKIISKY